MSGLPVKSISSNKKQYLSHKLRMESDPVYAAKYREKRKAEDARYYARKAARQGRRTKAQVEAENRARAEAREAEKLKSPRYLARLERINNPKPWQMLGLSKAEKHRIRYKLDPEFNIRVRMRAHFKRKRQGIRIGDMLRSAVVRNGSTPTAEAFVGYTAKDLRIHLERQFTDGMNWDAFCNGEIHIDHIIPLTAHDLSNADELRAAWQLYNLRPLWAKDNLEKKDKIISLL